MADLSSYQEKRLCLLTGASDSYVWGAEESLLAGGGCLSPEAPAPSLQPVSPSSTASSAGGMSENSPVSQSAEDETSDVIGELGGIEV